MSEVAGIRRREGGLARLPGAGCPQELNKSESHTSCSKCLLSSTTAAQLPQSWSTAALERSRHRLATCKTPSRHHCPRFQSITSLYEIWLNRLSAVGISLIFGRGSASTTTNLPMISKNSSLQIRRSELYVQRTPGLLQKQLDTRIELRCARPGRSLILIDPATSAISPPRTRYRAQLIDPTV